MSDQSYTKLSFESQFSLHLISSLVGTTRLQEYLEGFSNSAPLYWRTSLLDCENEGLRFADVSLLVKDTVAEASIGLFRRHKQSGSWYYTRGNLNVKTIRRHLEDLGIDIESTAPTVMAQSMAKALRNLEGPVIPEVGDLSTTCGTISLPLYYEDVEEVGQLELTIDSDCHLDGPTVHMILANIGLVSTENPSAEKYDAIQVETMFLTFVNTQTKKSPLKKQVSEKPGNVLPPVKRGVGGLIIGGRAYSRRKKPKALTYVSK